MPFPDNVELRQQILSQNPTQQQIDATFAEELEYLLRASPGSGKTWTSCRRFIWRGANWNQQDGGIALLSFTNTAIKEFQAATINVGRRELLSDPNYVGTFDSFVERFILSPFGHLIAGLKARPRLLNDPPCWLRNNTKLKVWISLSGNRLQPIYAWEIIPFPDGTKIAYKTKMGVLDSKDDAKNAIQSYLSMGYYTHSQRVFWAVILLSKKPQLAKMLAMRFPEIIVDEAQDTNAWLLVLLNQIRNEGAKVTLVGDPDQCIYEFSMADVATLPALKEKWCIPEKPLSRSFRCNDNIASAVKFIGGNPDFTGNGSRINDKYSPLIVREANDQFSQSIATFKLLLDSANIEITSSSILCRGHDQLERIRGNATYSNLKGLTLELAKASFIRDYMKDYKKATDTVEVIMRDLVGENDLWNRIDEQPDSDEAFNTKLTIWRFVKSSSGLPSISLNGIDWINSIRHKIGLLLHEIGIKEIPNLNMKIKRTGLDDNQMSLPLMETQPLFPQISQETIHQVKGESIDGILVLGSERFWNIVVKSVSDGTSTEERRLAYVAMTRARQLLVVGLPAKHFDKNSAKWVSWGFKVFDGN